jgi:outer membrane protein
MLTLRQVKALAASGIKSTLDVSFAEVALSESELALYKAENDAKTGLTLLAIGMGEQSMTPYQLVDVVSPGKAEANVESLVEDAIKNRPEISAARLNQSAAERYVEAERRLKYPTVSATAAVGTAPLHEKNLVDHYSAAGINISLPFLNGGMYASRQAEAQLRARMADKDAKVLGVQIAGSVRTGWLEADTAWRRIDVTLKLVEQTRTAVRLAQTRYDTGLSGILELTQSQLSLVSAQIAAANAKYDYLISVANLNYAIGAIR